MVLSQVAARNVDRVPIHTRCIGPAGAVNEAFMKQLAQQNGGIYSRIVQ